MTTQPANSTQKKSLPPWLARHMKIGYSDDDVWALFRDIESSQGPYRGPRSLPYMPPELVACILTYIPPSHVLPFRLVCKSFRDTIDKIVFYSYLERMQLEFGAIPCEILKSAQRINMREALLASIRITARFERSVRAVHGSATTMHHPTNWNGDRAVFRLEDTQLNALSQIEGFDAPVFLDLLRSFFMKQPLGVANHRRRWLLTIDTTVNSFLLPEVEFNLEARTVSFNWRPLMWMFLKEENAIRLTLDAHTAHTTFTFSRLEDCFRVVGRQRFEHAIKRQYPKGNQSRAKHLMQVRAMIPLFNHANTEIYTSTSAELDLEEDRNVKLVLPLRILAAMSSAERAAHEQWLTDWKDMQTEEKGMQDLFKDWYKNVYENELSMTSYRRSPSLKPTQMDLLLSDERRAQEEKRVRKWKANRANTTKIRELLQSAQMVAGLSEDAFDSSSEP